MENVNISVFENYSVNIYIAVYETAITERIATFTSKLKLMDMNADDSLLLNGIVPDFWEIVIFGVVIILVFLYLQIFRKSRKLGETVEYLYDELHDTKNELFAVKNEWQLLRAKLKFLDDDIKSLVADELAKITGVRLGGGNVGEPSISRNTTQNFDNFDYEAKPYSPRSDEHCDNLDVIKDTKTKILELLGQHYDLNLYFSDWIAQVKNASNGLIAEIKCIEHVSFGGRTEVVDHIANHSPVALIKTYEGECFVVPSCQMSSRRLDEGIVRHFFDVETNEWMPSFFSRVAMVEVYTEKGVKLCKLRLDEDGNAMKGVISSG